ncbi:MAG: hypothetical protein ACLQBA_15495 [Candidatus Binataceae bacterium]
MVSASSILLKDEDNHDFPVVMGVRDARESFGVSPTQGNPKESQKTDLLIALSFIRYTEG